MYTQADYLYGWLIYLVGVAIVMGCGWVITARIPNKETRHLLRLFAGVVLVMPWYAAEGLNYLAPAWIIAGFEGLIDGKGGFWRAGAPLLITLVLALIVSIGIQLVLRIRNR